MGSDRIIRSNGHNGNVTGNGTRTEQALRASELSYRRLFEAAQDGILILDVDTGHINDANPFLVKLLGFPRSEMVGKTVGELSPFKDLVANQAMLERLQEDGYVRYHDLPLETKGGLKIAVEFVSNVYPVGDKKVIQCNIRDIRARKSFDGKMRQLSQAVEQSPASVVITDTKGTIEYVNRKFTEVTGYSLAEVVGKNPRFLKSGECPSATYQKMWARITSGGTWSGELHNRKKNGELFWEWASISPVLDTRGKTTHFLAVKEDITERKLAEKQINSLARFPAENPNPVLRVSARGILEYANVAADSFFQTMGAEVGGTVSAEWQARIGEALAKEHPVNIELQVGNGTFGVTLAPVVAYGYVNLYASDITERKQAEESNVRLAAIVEFSEDAIIGKSLDGIIQSWNAGAEKLFGYSAGEMTGDSIMRLVPADRQAEEDQILEKIRHGESVRNFETVLQAKDGRQIDVSVTVSPIKDSTGKIVGASNVTRDITERRKLEAQIRQSQKNAEEVLRKVSRQATDRKKARILLELLIVFGLGTLTYAVLKYTNFLQAPFEKFIFNYRNDLDEVFGTLVILLVGFFVFSYRRWREVKSQVGEQANIEAALRILHGELEKRVEQRTEELTKSNDALKMEIIERKQAEAALIRPVAIVESSDDAIIGKDLNGIITNWNKGAEKIYGYTASEVVGTSIMRLIPADRPDEENQILETIKRGESMKHFETLRQTRDGRLIDVSVTASPIRDVTGKIIGVSKVARDITERRKLEAQFRQSQKMEAIGQLAGGVAHDFNNILAVIQLQAGLLKAEQDLSLQQLDLAGEIEKAAERAANLTRQLLLFSRRQTMQPRDLDLNQSINDMAKMLRRTLGEDIQLQFKCDMQSLFIHADAGMMDQVLMNLAVNARDAMPKGGQLVIETSVANFDASVRAQSARTSSGSLVCLSVSDTGCGIPPEIVPRIFEPFFTTKDVGKGTGLGLATVFGIVEQHQGWINVHSEVGHGTTFHIYLPQLTKISKREPEQPTLISTRGGNETILLVEDDIFLHASVRKSLSQLGYRVLEAINGIEALEVWKQNRGGIHLLLTDLVMPGGMTGKDLGERLLKENPKLKVIYASGYSGEIAGKDFPLEEGVNFLAKPFQTQKLAQTVRNCLDNN